MCGGLAPPSCQTCSAHDHPALAGEIYRIASYEYWGEKRYEDARRLYKYIVDNLAESEYVILSRGGVIMSDLALGNDGKAQAAIDNLIADSSDNPLIARVVWDTAQVYRELKKYEKAKELYQHVIDNWPEAEHAISSRMSMAEINILSLIESGKDTAAQAALDRLIDDFKGHPDLPEALFEIGELYYSKSFRHKNEGLEAEARENFRKAIALWERIITELPESTTTAQAYNFIGNGYRQLGEYEMAIEYYTTVIENWPYYMYSSLAQFRIGRCYKHLRNAGVIPEDKANTLIKDAYIRVLENYPDSLSAKDVRIWLKNH